MTQVASKCLTMSVLFYRLINYCNNTRDFMVPSVWGQVCRRSSIAMNFLVETGARLTSSDPRSTSVRTRMLLNNKEVAVSSCNGHHDTELSPLMCNPNQHLATVAPPVARHPFSPSYYLCP